MQFGLELRKFGIHCSQNSVILSGDIWMGECMQARSAIKA